MWGVAIFVAVEIVDCFFMERIIAVVAIRLRIRID
jgi:hypothetical protein